jgi:hypothetical protein
MAWINQNNAGNLGTKPRATHTVMYDKFVILELEEWKTQAEATKDWAEDHKNEDGSLPGKIIAADQGELNNIVYSKTNKMIFGVNDQKQFVSGVKPFISVSAEFRPQYRVTEVIVSVQNLEYETDISKYFYMTVEFGYLNGKSRKIRGPIMNSYIESPNPNGKTVFQMFEAGFASQLLQPSNILVQFNGKEKWLDSLRKAVGAIRELPPLIENLPATPDGKTSYEDIPMMNINASKSFGSPQAVINYYSKIGRAIFRSYGLEPPVIYSDTDGVHVSTASRIAGNKKDMPELTIIKTATFTGGGISVKLPFNPEIDVMKSFFIDPRYFRGRFNAKSVMEGNHIVDVKTGKKDTAVGVAADGIYTCISYKVVFDTEKSNDMTILGVMSSEVDTKSAIQQNVAAQSKQSLDQFGALQSSPWITPSSAAPVEAAHSDPSNSKTDQPKSSKPILKGYVWKKGETGYSVFGKGNWLDLCNEALGYEDEATEDVKQVMYKNSYEATLITSDMQPGMTVYYPEEWDDAEGGSPPWDYNKYSGMKWCYERDELVDRGAKGKK